MLVVNRLLASGGNLPKWPDLDTSRSSTAFKRELRCPADHLIQVFAIQNVISGEKFLGFSEGTIHGDQLAFLHAERRGRAGRLQWLRTAEDAKFLGLIHNSPVCSLD